MDETLIEELENVGVDAVEALSSFDENVEEYIENLRMFLEDEDHELLKVYLDAGNLDKAFTSAFGLKVMLKGVGVKEAGEPLLELIDCIRKGRQEDSMELYEDFESNCVDIMDVIDSI